MVDLDKIIVEHQNKKYKVVPCLKEKLGRNLTTKETYFFIDFKHPTYILEEYSENDITFITEEVNKLNAR